MSPYSLNLLANFYADKLRELPIPRSATEHHALFMCSQIISGQIRGEKAQRWLGFIQALLWTAELYTINDMREHVRTALEA